MDNYSTHSHTLIIRGSMTRDAVEDLVWQRVSGEITILGVEPQDGNMLVRIDPNILQEAELEGRLNRWMNDQYYLDHQLVWWNRNPEWFNA